MSDAQAWTLIGALIATIMGTIALTATLLVRFIESQIGGLRNEMIIRLEALDRDLQRLYERVFRSNGA